MSESIKRIEERHPLPWEYRDYNNIGVVLDANERLVFFSSIKDNLNREETLRFLVSHTNLIQEMLAVLTLASEALEAVYDSSYCETCTDSCAEVDCVLWRARRDCDAALAKLEKGANE